MRKKPESLVRNLHVVNSECPDLDTDDLSGNLLVIFSYSGVNRFSNFLHKSF